MVKESFREELLRGPVVFDGGMGTYFSSSEKRPGKGCEMANLEKPILVSAIHQEYLEAGARAIKTNTFASNRVAYPGGMDVVKRQIRAGYRLAKRAADRYDAHVFADIGPVSELNEEETIEVDSEIVRRYQGLERAEAENLAVRISTEVAKAMDASVDGFYVITPFNRTELVRRVVESIRGLSVNS